jgi:hypothetical protein
MLNEYTNNGLALVGLRTLSLVNYDRTIFFGPFQFELVCLGRVAANVCVYDALGLGVFVKCEA